MSDVPRWLEPHAEFVFRTPLTQNAAIALGVEHCLQYALVVGLQFPYSPAVWGTENMSDHEILRFLLQHSSDLTPLAAWKLRNSDLRGGAPIYGVFIRRKNECILCGMPSPCNYKRGDLDASR